VGDCWDHIAFDPEHRLVLEVVFGRRSQGNIQKLAEAVKLQMEGRLPRLITTDAYTGYAEVFQRVFGTVIKLRHKRGEPKLESKRKIPKELTFATVTKVMEKGRVVKVGRELVLGSERNLDAALRASSVSSTINTSFIERHNATDRHQNARKHRKTYCFSKDLEVHKAAGGFVLYSYNFCWCVSTLRKKRQDGTYQKRTPAMAAGLSDHVWSIAEWLRYPAVDRSR